MAEIEFISKMRNKAKDLCLKVAFPDAEDIRTLQASRILKDEKIAIPVLVGNKTSIESFAGKNNIDIQDIEIFDPNESQDLDKYAQILFEKRKSKGMTFDEAKNTMKDPLYFAGMLLEDNKVGVTVAGNISSTGNVLRAAIYTVGTAPGISIVSSFFIMAFPDNRLLCFGDCAVNPDPNPAQLADIAISSSKNFEAVTGLSPKTALLSFSTKGSADHPLVDKVKEAVQIMQEKAPELLSDGELQLDAAIVPSIGERKSPGSKVAGNANVLIFPDLNAGNIGYKLIQRLAGAEAVGPFVQGLAKPYCDLSRGCSADDMVNVAAICSLMA